MSSEDFKSFIVTNPDLVDEGIDISGLRTNTDASILGNIPDYGGIQYEAYNPNRLSDLMRLYSGGFPMLVTPQATAPVTTTPDTGGGGGMDQATLPIDTPITTDITSDQINEFAMPTNTGGITSDPIEMENLSPIDIGTVDDYDDLNDYENAVAAANISGTISGAPDVFDINQTGDPSQNPGSINVGDTTPGVFDYESEAYGIEPSISTIANPEIFDPYGASVNDPQIGDPGFTGYTPSSGTVNELTDDPTMQETISNAFTSARQGIGDLATAGVDQIQEVGRSIANTIGGMYNGEDQSISILGKEINVPATLGGIALNQVVGAPISLAFSALRAIGGMLPDGIETTTNKARETGLIQGDSTVTQDIYGINTQSMFGDYNQYNIDRVEQLEDKINKTPRDERELIQRKDYIDSSGALGDINPEGTGDASVAESVYANEEPIGDQGSTVNTQTSNKTESSGNYAGNIMDEFEPAPAPAPAPAPTYGPYSSGGGGGGGGGSSSGGGGESGYGGFCFDPNTPIQMADGSNKKIKNIQLGDDTKGGEVTGVFQFKATDEIHDYKGVTVAGSHYVKEDGKFIMVQDSPISIKIDKIPVVYSLDTTGRRIFIKDIEFADYNGDGIAKGFLHNAGVDTKGFDKEVLRQVEQRLI
jgi:hypothetical protein